MPITIGITGDAMTPAGATEERFFRAPDGNARCTRLFVKTATGAAKIRIPELHGETGYANLAIGESREFEHSEITAAYVTGATAVLTWYPTASIRNY